MRTRLFRAALCFVLIAALIVNISPVKAKATGTGLGAALTSMGVSAPIVVGGILIGLGIMAAASTDWDYVVERATEFAAARGFVDGDGNISIFRYQHPDGTWRFYADGSLVDLLFGWAWASDTLSVNMAAYTVPVSNGLFGPGEWRSDVPIYVCTSVCGGVVYEHVLSSESGYAAFYDSSGKRIARSDLLISTSSYTSCCYETYWSRYEDSSFASNCVVNHDGNDCYLMDGHLKYLHLNVFPGIMGSLGDVTSNGSLVLGEVAPAGTVIADGYPAWAAGSTVVPSGTSGSDEDRTVYPVGIGGTLEETRGKTQEEVQTGEGSYIVIVPGGVPEESEPTEPTEPGSDNTGNGIVTGNLLERLFGGVQSKLDVIEVSITEIPELLREFMLDVKTGFQELPTKFADWFDGIKALLQQLIDGQISFGELLNTLLGGIPSQIIDFFTISAEDLVLPITWTDFFPFCIPSDIKSFVEVFDAEPEAPHFVFDVDFPYMNEPWHIDLDFSAWDPVALVLRRLELMLFIVGLAMATRNYYIRG